VDLTNAIYALDSTTIDLCLSLFPWARFRSTKAAVKLHTLLDVRGSIPTFIHLTEGKCADVKILDLLPVEPGSIYVVDRGYLDFRRLYRLTQQGAWWVTRSKCHVRLKRLVSRPVDKASGLRCDQIVWLATKYFFEYPARLRRIRYFDAETGKSLVFLTNHLELPALVIARLYKLRWRVELFFKWIKQHLRIRSFYGTSDNAVLTQVWIAVCVYVMISIVRKELLIGANQTTMMHILTMATKLGWKWLH
jgi:IS4 transposase